MVATENDILQTSIRHALCDYFPLCKFLPSNEFIQGWRGRAVALGMSVATVLMIKKVSSILFAQPEVQQTNERKCFSFFNYNFCWQTTCYEQQCSLWNFLWNNCIPVKVCNLF